MAVTDTQNHWVETMPPKWQPFLKLARIDRPIGTWLLLWPCLWSMFLAARVHHLRWPTSTTLILVIAGAILMRGAGCTLNDIMDRKYDRCVQRTACRPLAAGEISIWTAWLFLGLQLFFAAHILFFFNKLAIYLGLAILPVVMLYPLMKRITFWPQLWLGLAFNWGAFLGWAIICGHIDPRAGLLYIGGIFWTLGYDTIYAHQDREDDALLGLKSTALLFGSTTKLWLSFFYINAWICFFMAALNFAPLHLVIGLSTLAHLAYQVRHLNIHKPETCLELFRSNRLFGLLVFIYFVTA